MPARRKNDAVKLFLPLRDRGRRFGYVFWQKGQHDEVLEFFAGRATVDVLFNAKPLGERSIDYRYKRISIGSAQTQHLPHECCRLSLTFRKDGRLEIVCI